MNWFADESMCLTQMIRGRQKRNSLLFWYCGVHFSGLVFGLFNEPNWTPCLDEALLSCMIYCGSSPNLLYDPFNDRSC
jgi:hypothetical protein